MILTSFWNVIRRPLNWLTDPEAQMGKHDWSVCLSVESQNLIKLTLTIAIQYENLQLDRGKNRLWSLLHRSKPAEINRDRPLRTTVIDCNVIAAAQLHCRGRWLSTPIFVCGSPRWQNYIAVLPPPLSNTCIKVDRSNWPGSARRHFDNLVNRIWPITRKRPFWERRKILENSWLKTRPVHYRMKSLCIIRQKSVQKFVMNILWFLALSQQLYVRKEIH